MLECNFNELDDDFITLWSRYMLSHDETQIAADLEKLAELGQINAVQSYYLFLINAGAGVIITNSEIDKRVDETFYSRNFNHLLAQAHKIYATDIEDRYLLSNLLEAYMIEVEEFEKKNKEVKSLTPAVGPYLEEQREAAVKSLNYWLQSNEATINKIKNTKFWSKQHEAIMACLEYAESTHDAVVFERYFELAASSIGGQLNDAIDSRELKRDAKTARKEIAQRRKKNPSSILDFALAKNLIFFSEKEKHFKLGRQILTDLANRTLSKTLSEYQPKGTPTLANSVYENTITNTID